jgi:hypothetical protein
LSVLLLGLDLFSDGIMKGMGFEALSRLQGIVWRFRMKEQMLWKVLLSDQRYIFIVCNQIWNII